MGVLTFFLSIRPLKLNSPLIRLTPHPSLPLWTIRWLLFKFMFSSGVVKLTSRCPIWWSLRALDMHFESTCIPTPLSWYAHQLPTNWLHLAVALCLVLEIVLPFLFFTPYRSLKIFSFVTQVTTRMNLYKFQMFHSTISGVVPIGNYFDRKFQLFQYSNNNSVHTTVR